MKVRTQVLMEKEQYQYAKKLADKRNISFSAVVREYLPKPPRRTKRMQNARDVLEGIEKLGKTMDWNKTPRDLSTTIDDYLYGKKSKFARISTGKQ